MKTTPPRSPPPRPRGTVDADASLMIMVQALAENLTVNKGQSLFDMLPDVRFFLKDIHGVYTYASRTLILAHGFTDPAQIVGITDHDFIPGYLADYYTRDDQQVLQGKEIWGRIELVIRHQGLADWHSTSKIPLRSAQGDIIGLVGLSRDLRIAAQTASPFTKLAPALDFIRANFGARIEAAQLASIARTSLRSFQRYFKEALHMSPAEYVRQFRVGRASQLLVETDQTVAAIAQDCGFCDHSHFTREFVKTTAMAPGAYRKKYRGALFDGR